MSIKPELATLLDGVESAEARERIVNAYHSLSGADPEGFAVQFAILGAAIATRIERSVSAAQAAVDQAAKLNYSPEAVAAKVLKDVPNFRDMKQLSESLKLAVNHLNQTKPGRGALLWISAMFLLTLVNTVILAWMSRG